MAENKAGIEDIIAMNALYRPGPEKFIPDFIQGRKDASKIQYACKELEPILAPTYGQIVYQEQVMQIVRDLAGYTWGRSDLVRRAMSKKHQDEIDAERQTFVYGNKDTRKEGEALVPGCIANGISEQVAHKIWDDMVDFAKYAFNKSHATAYSVTSYWTAYLKYYYPAYYLANIMNYASKVEELADDIADARDFGVEVLPPDINKSNLKCDVIENNKIVYGLSNIKNVGSQAEIIISNREMYGPYNDIIEFIQRTHVDVGALDALIKAGTFDSLGYTRNQIALDTIAMSDVLALSKKIRDKENFIINANKVIEFIEDYFDLDELKERIKEENISFQITSKKVPTKDSIYKRINSAKDAIEQFNNEMSEIELDYIEDDLSEKLENEKSVLGIYISGHPIDDYIVVTDPISDIQLNNDSVSGIITDFTVRKNKSGNDWATFTIEDKTGNMSGVCFAKDFASNRMDLYEGAKVCITGKIQIDDFKSTEEEEVYQIIANSVKPLKKTKSSYRIICSVMDLNSVLDELSYDDILTDNSDDDVLYWIDSTTGLCHKLKKYVNPNNNQSSILQKV